MKTVKPNKTFIIRHKQTKEQWKASSGKSSWKAINHAKAAWAYCTYVKFNEQDDYEVVELKPECEDKLQEACELLEEMLHHLPDSDYSKVTRFLEGNSNDE